MMSGLTPPVFKTQYLSENSSYVELQFRPHKRISLAFHPYPSIKNGNSAITLADIRSRTIPEKISSDKNYKT